MRAESLGITWLLRDSLKFFNVLMDISVSRDNANGLALAVSSSVFIGSSFIIKKKGLKKAGSTGVRAGICAT